MNETEPKPYTKEELLEQSKIILSELDYHEIIRHANALHSGLDTAPFIKNFHTAHQIREELTNFLNQFIDTYLEKPSFENSSYINSTWLIEFNYEELNEERPYLSVSCRCDITSETGAAHNEYFKD